MELGRPWISGLLYRILPDTGYSSRIFRLPNIKDQHLSTSVLGNVIMDLLLLRTNADSDDIRCIVNKETAFSVADPDPVGFEPFLVGSGSDQLPGSDKKNVTKQQINLVR